MEESAGVGRIISTDGGRPELIQFTKSKRLDETEPVAVVVHATMEGTSVQGLSGPLLTSVTV